MPVDLSAPTIAKLTSARGAANLTIHPLHVEVHELHVVSAANDIAAIRRNNHLEGIRFVGEVWPVTNVDVVDVKSFRGKVVVNLTASTKVEVGPESGDVIVLLVGLGA